MDEEEDAAAMDREVPAAARAARADSPAQAPRRHAPIMDERPYGFHACMAIFRTRPQDILRVYVTQDRVPEAGPLLKHCARNRLAYHVVDDEELARITSSQHHEGIAVLCRARPDPTAEHLWADLADTSRPVTLVLLENVGNPHNVGAIVRVAAHFGVPWVLCAGQTPHARSGALVRTAEGGAEHVRLLGGVPTPELVAGLKQRGVSVLATSHRGNAELGQAPLPTRCAWLLGAEGTGLTPELVAMADETVRIGGAGHVESLNVACATSTLLGESWRQQRLGQGAQAQPARGAPARDERPRGPRTGGKPPRGGAPGGHAHGRRDGGRRR